MTTFWKILRHSRAKKFVPRSSSVPLNGNNRSKELRWLASVEMFFAKRVLVVQTIKYLLHLAASCMKI